MPWAAKGPLRKKIIAKEADYILMAKENQAELKEQMEKVFRIQKPETTNIQEDLGHGTIEKRTCEMITKLDFLNTIEHWTGLRHKGHLGEGH